MKMARCMFQGKEIMNNHWVEAIHIVVYILHKSPTEAVKSITPEKT
jgi:hypothetical protein